MKEQGKRIRTGILLTFLTVAGFLEYVQLVQEFDLPQIMLVVPLVGALAVVFLEKMAVVVPACTILLACFYQIVAGDTNAIAKLQTSAKSIAIILLECLSILLVFELIGMAGGALVRILVRKKRNMGIAIACAVAGVVLVLGPYVALFHNPLYPVTARRRLTSYAEEHFTDYPIAEKKIYYSMNVSDYQCRVSMADGQIRVIYIGEDGEVKQQ